VASAMLVPLAEMRVAWVMLLLVGCSGGEQHSTDAGSGRGTATVRFSPAALPAGPLLLRAGNGQLEDVLLYGDVQSSPEAMLHDVPFGPLDPATDVVFAQLPQGLYSRLRISIDWMMISGSWKGTPLQVAFAIEDNWIDLRSPTARELSPGESIRFAVAVDVSSWFAGVDWSDAVVDDGVIRIDDFHNSALTRAIANAVPASFSVTDQ
jgi:hypothetical protein